MVADLVAGGVDDGELIGLDQGEVVIAGGDEPVPLGGGEEIVAAGVVGGGIRAAEDAGEKGGSEIVVRGAAADPLGKATGPADHEGNVHLVLAEGRAVAGEPETALVELHAVIRGDEDDGAVEELTALEILEDAPDEGVDVVERGQVAGVLAH